MRINWPINCDSTLYMLTWIWKWILSLSYRATWVQGPPRVCHWPPSTDQDEYNQPRCWWKDYSLVNRLIVPHSMLRFPLADGDYQKLQNHQRLRNIPGPSKTLTRFGGKRQVELMFVLRWITAIKMDIRKRSIVQYKMCVWWDPHRFMLTREVVMW